MGGIDLKLAGPSKEVSQSAWNNVKNLKRDLVLCLQEFEKFYDLLMKEAPEGYTPWFFACAKNNKDPAFEKIKQHSPEKNKSWKHEGARLTKEECVEHIKEGYNLGISARAEDPLILIDIDDEKYLHQLPKGTLTATSRKRGGGHAFCWDKDGTAKTNIATDDGELRSLDMYVLACGSYVQFDSSSIKDKKAFYELSEEAQQDELLGHYTLKDANTPKFITFDDLPELFKEREKVIVEAEAEAQQREEKKTYDNKEGKYTQLFNLRVSDIIGKSDPNKRVGHPLHESTTNANWSLSGDGVVGHCWRCDVSLNAVQYLCVKAGYSECSLAGTPHARKGKDGEKISQGKSKIRGDKEAYKVAYDEALKLGLIEEYKSSQSNQRGIDIFTTEGQAEEFIKKQPLYYDDAGFFWHWDFDNYCYVKSDKVDVLNSLKNINPFVETIKSKERSEIINALMQVGRKNKPKEPKKTWIQFKDIIVDVQTGEEFKATPEYFITNPIPFSPSDSELTPTMDKIFKEWVVCEGLQDESYIKTLYQVVAYVCTSDQFLQRLIALTGSGSNGKGTFLQLLTKLIGLNNCCSTELRVLGKNSFEASSLYKKLLCEMGEVDATDLKNTNLIKKLSGEDLIRYEFKGKTAFTEESPTTCIISTNSLPKTPDSSIGFYRRWLIIDFPNQFKVKRDILAQIPEEEYNNLARKVINLLKELYKDNDFVNGGDFEERMKKYEERSNPLNDFIKERCEEEPESMTSLREFTNEYNKYLLTKKLRKTSPRELGKELRDETFEVSSRKINGKGTTSVMGLSIITTSTTSTTNDVTQSLRKRTTLPLNGSNGSNGFTRKEIESAGYSKEDFPETDEFFNKIREKFK